MTLIDFKAKKESLFLMTLVVDNSFEISNISLTPSDFELTIQLIEIIHYYCNL